MRKTRLLPHNLKVTDEATSRGPGPGEFVAAPTGPTAPQSIPDLADAGDEALASPEAGAAVSDEDRTSYGLLLDRAAERGLLSPYDYQVRLGELADATSIDEMKRIVTELPLFTAPPVIPTTKKRSRPAPGDAAAAPRRRASPWVLLAIVVVAVLVVLVIFTVYAEHVVHGHGSGALLTGSGLSALRL